MSSDSLQGPTDSRTHCESCVGLGTVPEFDVQVCKVTGYCIHGNNPECGTCDGRGFVEEERQ